MPEAMATATRSGSTPNRRSQPLIRTTMSTMAVVRVVSVTSPASSTRETNDPTTPTPICHEAKIHWNNHVDAIHDTIRGADPAPGAWTTIGGKKLQLFGSKKHLVRTFGAVKGKIGEITEIGPESMRITAQGGQVEISKVKPEEGKKIPAAEWAKSASVAVGTLLGT